eukprot:TRINITY_DN738_c0_g1_i1.p1 TRINITY_DN738_c0_g1~~TRINITY_DN738_c0_g1_i1.p1  ORF type:complete len:202 (-),score=39.47 TRINITY_DN738_c0_g1_i1:155-760(-)
MAEPEVAAVDQNEEEAAFLESLKKKKKKKKPEGEAAAPEGSSTEEASYTYAELLARVFDQVRLHNPSLTEKKKYTLKPPNVVRDGTKKSAFTNFQDICKSMNRQIDHLLAFILAELGTSGSIDANNCLILKGRFTPKQVEGLLRKYIAEYVQCAMCHSLDTKLNRDQSTRLFLLQCNSCAASRSVASILSGFHAQIGRRKR